MKSLKQAKKSAKEVFLALYEAAQAEYKDAAYDPDHQTPDAILVFAWDNADDTAKENPSLERESEAYFQIALGSIQSSAEAYCVFDEVQAFCKKHGYTI
jgi:hypothetical protein